MQKRVSQLQWRGLRRSAEKEVGNQRVVWYTELCVVLSEAVLSRWEESYGLRDCVSDGRATTG